MIGKKVEYENKIYSVLHDYQNGQIEIKREDSKLYTDIKLVTKEEVKVIQDMEKLT
ncbi:hypothetical protein IMZ08_13615 [Bacillus luteolus]|uniref:Uncharacterized protein n=1 Tax=Litchfieldia luteola TaxID=682179 RepID=A0ABR9QKR9_9BACI|nr:hypothetical protein [Cytobacillus luteolus]MBE4909101.1 hypothetical protein [Cytobacillus luteolus]MBP1940449.1 hypothetical protein [Cytobacillus luteolus]